MDNTSPVVSKHIAVVILVLIKWNIPISVSANVSIVDIDSNQEENIATSSSGNNFGLDLKADDKIYFGGLPTLRNLR